MMNEGGCFKVDERDKQLIRDIAAGDHESFKKLYQLYADYALRTAYGITRNKADASDIVQETFIKVYRHIGSFQQDKSFKPWFYRILVNEARTLIAKRARQPIAIEREQTLDLLNEEEDAEANELLYSALDQLRERDRSILMLKYLIGFKEKEIAHMLELNVNTVKSRLYQARNRLRKILGGEVDEAR